MPILRRFLSVSCLTLLVLLPSSNVLATQASTSGFVDDNASADENKSIEFYFNLDRRKQVILYGLGPSAADNLGRSNVLPDPLISLYRLADDGNYVQIDSNNNWQEHPSADQTRQALEDFGASLDPLEAAMVLQLDAGTYRLDLGSAVSGASGWAIAGGAEWLGGSGPGGGDIQGGVWRGQTSTYDVCFNVASDGSRLTPSGSPCGEFGGGESFYVSIPVGGLSGAGCEGEDADVDWDVPVNIVNNSFRQSIDFGWFGGFEVEGTFSNGVLNGTVTYSALGLRCTGTFEARPE